MKIFLSFLFFLSSVHASSIPILEKEFETLKKMRQNNPIANKDMINKVKRFETIISGESSKVTEKTFATASERTSILGGLFQNAIIRKYNNLKDETPRILSSYPQYIQNHLVAYTLMKKGVQAFVENPLMMLNRHALLTYLKYTVTLSDVMQAKYLNIETLNILFPQGFFEHVATYANNFKDYENQKLIKLAIEFHKIEPNKPLKLYANQSIDMTYDADSNLFNYFDIDNNALTLNEDALVKIGAAQQRAQKALKNSPKLADDIRHFVQELDIINVNTYLEKNVFRFLPLMKTCEGLDPRGKKYTTKDVRFFMNRVFYKLRHAHEENQTSNKHVENFFNTLKNMEGELEVNLLEYLNMLEFLQEIDLSFNSLNDLCQYFKNKVNSLPNKKIIHSLNKQKFRYSETINYLPQWNFRDQKIDVGNIPFYFYINYNINGYIHKINPFKWSQKFLIQIACQKAFFNRQEHKEKYTYPADNVERFSEDLKTDEINKEDAKEYEKAELEESGQKYIKPFKLYNKTMLDLLATLYIRHQFGDDDDCTWENTFY